MDNKLYITTTHYPEKSNSYRYTTLTLGCTFAVHRIWRCTSRSCPSGYHLRYFIPLFCCIWDIRCTTSVILPMWAGHRKWCRHGKIKLQKSPFGKSWNRWKWCSIMLRYHKAMEALNVLPPASSPMLRLTLWSRLILCRKFWMRVSRMKVKDRFISM